MGIEYPSQGEMRFVDLGDPPIPGPTEILIETRFSGVTNGTERHALLGEHGWKDHFPSRHGYQHVGTVVEVGKSVRDLTEGDWVFYGRYVGHRGWNLQDLSWADPTSNASHLVIPIPSQLDKEPCVLFGVAGVAMRAVRRLRVDGSQKVWVVGAGPIGLFAAQAARAYGAHVTLTDLIPSRLSVAERIGADVTIDASGKDSMDALRDGGPYDRIIDASGAKGLLADIQRHRLLSHAGAIGLIAVRSQTCFEWGMLHGTEASIEVSCHFSLQDLAVLIGFVKRRVIRIDPVITHRAGIEDAPVIYKTLRDSPWELLGVIFDWR